MSYYSWIYLAFLTLGCWYFAVMGIRQTIEVVNYIRHEIATLITIRKQKKILETKQTPPAGVTRPSLEDRRKLWPKK